MHMNVKRNLCIFFLAFVTVMLFLSGCESGDQRGRNRDFKEEDYYMALGDDHLGDHAYNYATQLYDEVLIKDPDNAEAKYKREQAQAIIDLANDLIAKGDEAVAEKRIDAAYAYFQQAEDLFPYNEDDGYSRNLAVFEIENIQYYLDQLSELYSQWKKIKEQLNNGKSLSSKSITSSIEELYPLAQEVYNTSEVLKAPTSSGATLFYEDNELDMDKMMKEFIVYQIIPQPPLYRFEEVDEYVVQVKRSIEAFGLDFQYEDADDLIKELYFINRPELKELRDQGNFPDLKMFEKSSDNN